MDTVASLEDMDNFKDIIQDILSNLYTPKTSTSLLNTKALYSFKEELKHVLLESNFHKKNIIKYLHNKGWSEEKSNCFLTIFEEQKRKLLYETLVNHNVSHCESIVNFDWNLKLVLGSSELKAVRYPLLQLTFSTKTPNGHEDNVMCELNKNMLEKLIEELESLLKCDV